jgi:PBSX family phage terminase large subunit
MTMQFEQFSQKQLLTLNWWHMPQHQKRDAIICDGSIRSGKTLAMTVGFVLWSMSTFDGQMFAICGKTIESLRRNVILPMQTWLEGVVQMQERRAQNCVEITCGGVKNRYFLFGGRDESSYTLIQGITLAGVLLDEVALMPRSFVEQALARCSLDGSRFWFNCNPEYPGHWFNLEWIQAAESKNALHLHYTMDDNRSLSPAARERYDRLYQGVFYERYVLGLWRVAEGLVYTMFDKAMHVVPSVPREYEQYVVSCDYGTVNPTSMGLWGLCNGKWYRVREYYYDSRKEGSQRTDEEHYHALEELVAAIPDIVTTNAWTGDTERRSAIQRVIVDPSAASFMECIHRHGRFIAEKASNAVLSGIRDTATHLLAGDFFICDACKDCIREFGLYRWDEKARDDRPLKTDDHAMDDMRYFVRSVFRPNTFSFD